MPDIKFSNKYPYTDFHELNLDWVIKEVKYWSTKVGKTIQSIELTGTVGLVDTYTINYSDGTTSTFDVTNGNGITSIEKTETAGLVDTYTIIFQDGSTTEFYVRNGAEAVDPTLTLSDYAADAKVTGDLIRTLDDTVTDINEGKTPIIFSLVANEYVTHDGSFVAFNTWSRTDYIPVTRGKIFYYYSENDCPYNCWYDENQQPVGTYFILYGGPDSLGNPRRLNPPAGAAYMALSNTTINMNKLKLWYPPIVINDSEAASDRTYSSEKIETLVNDLPMVILPAELYAVEDSEISIYFDNILLGNYDKCAIGAQINNISWTMQYEERFCLTPPIGSAGDYTIIINFRNKKTGDLLLKKELPLHVLPNLAQSSKSVLFIGDSLTNAGYYPYEIQEYLSNQGVTSIGTQISHPWFNGVSVTVNHEGRGGWSAHDYVSVANKGSVVNAFWNSITSKFDFAYYLSTYGFNAPDIVFLNLGTNGVNDSAEEVAAITEMIDSIHNYSSSIPVVVSLITPPAMQDGWTYITRGGSVDTFKRRQLLLNQEYITAFDHKISNVYVTPAYFNLDRQHDFPYSMQAVSSRNPYLVYRQTDNVHPASYGYLKMADVYWATIQMILGS